MALTRKEKNVVVIGGGTGTSIVLRGLKDYPVNLSAIITTADTGGSSGVLRREIGMSPPGDARQCFVALNGGEHPLIDHFNTRFAGGGLKGHTFGNVFLALLWENHDGDFQQAIEHAESIFDSKHSIIPATTQPTNLVAHLNTRRKIQGEADIIKVKNLSKKLKKLELVPEEEANPKAIKAIKKADYIVIGPGNLFASLTPPLLVDGIGEAVKKSKAKKIFILNLMNQNHLYAGYTAKDYIDHFKETLGEDVFDTIIYNTKKIDKKILTDLGIEDDQIKVSPKKHELRFYGADLVDMRISKQDPNDPLKRTYIRHDPQKIADVLFRIINK
ncbi:MAG: gluconeogenesis factor YvcK family protein [Candidatus Spechtbacterales bacterium]|nr:gluconeogenesis factor YvcK family protein [Candidatus Spechtbacterales bacterium]